MIPFLFPHLWFTQDMQFPFAAYNLNRQHRKPMAISNWAWGEANKHPARYLSFSLSCLGRLRFFSMGFFMSSTYFLKFFYSGMGVGKMLRALIRWKSQKTVNFKALCSTLVIVTCDKWLSLFATSACGCTQPPVACSTHRVWILFAAPMGVPMPCVPLSCSISKSAGLRGEGHMCNIAQGTAVTREWLWVVFTSQAAAPHCVLTGHTGVALSGIQMGGSSSNRTALHPSWILWPCLLKLEWISVQGSSSCKSPSATLVLFRPGFPQCSLWCFFLSLWRSAFLAIGPLQKFTLLFPCT